MATTQRRGGGGPRFNDDMVNAALILAGIFLILFFVLVVRLYFDKKEGRTIKLAPERSPARAIKSLISSDQ